MRPAHDERRSAGSAQAKALFLVCLVFVIMAVVFNHFVQSEPGPAPPDQCLANLERIKRAKSAWALDNMKLPTDVPAMSDLFGPDRFYHDPPHCPQGGVYTVGRVEAVPKCSFLGHTL